MNMRAKNLSYITSMKKEGASSMFLKTNIHQKEENSVLIPVPALMKTNHVDTRLWLVSKNKDEKCIIMSSAFTRFQ